MHNATSDSVWTVAEAKARLSEILRRTKTEGPQRKPMGQWLVDHMPRGMHLGILGDRESRREIPFMQEDTE